MYINVFANILRVLVIYRYMYTYIFKPAERDHGAPTFVPNPHAIFDKTISNTKFYKTWPDVRPEVAAQFPRGLEGSNRASRRPN